MGGCAQYTLCRRIDTTLIPIRIRYKMSKGMAVRTYDKPRHTYTHKQHAYIHTHTWYMNTYIIQVYSIILCIEHNIISYIIYSIIYIQIRSTVKLHKKKFTTNTPVSREFK